MTVALDRVVEIHAQEAEDLVAARMTLVGAPQVDLFHLRRADDRLAAHLDGFAVAADDTRAFSRAALETPTAGNVFTAAVRAIETKNEAPLERLFVLAEASSAAYRGLVSAFGWLERSQLRGVVAGLIGSSDPFRRAIGLSVCAIHRLDPEKTLAKSFQDPAPLVRSRALRAAGEIGRLDLLTGCAGAMEDEDAECRFWAAWSTVLLGDRSRALEALAAAGQAPGPHRGRAFRLTIQAMSATAAHATLQPLATDAKDRRRLIQGCGITGDPAYLPWLAKQMDEATTARIAGEAFALISGADLTEALDRPAPAGLDVGPTDDPNDPDVQMDQDEGLPWPDQNRVAEWLQRNAERFAGRTRYFMGAPLTREGCIAVLRHGYQRQRMLAAHYLCLLDPGTPLFNTSAPAWRQQRWLAKFA